MASWRIVLPGKTGQEAPAGVERGMARLALSALLLFAACAATMTQTPGTTGQGEPLPPPVAPTPGEGTPAPPAPTQPPPVAAPGEPQADAGAEADFHSARSRFEQGDREGSRAALESFVARHPDHGARRPAELMLARLALLRGDVGSAKKLLEPLIETPPEAGVASS